LFSPRGLALAAAAGAGAWGLFEAAWVRLVRRDVPVAGLHPDLAGLRIAHLSDLHVGAPGRNDRAFAVAVDLVTAEGADLICISGDLRARRAGDEALRAGLRRLAAPLGAFAVLGNHDFADGHDPFADGAALADLEDTPVRLLADEAVDLVRGDAWVRVGGIAPRTFEDHVDARGANLVGSADLRVLLCHFPPILDRLRPNEWDLVLAGHLHGGQICVPYPGGKVRLAHRSRTYLEGSYHREGTTMHVSRGVGTTFVPIRFAARPEVTVLRLVAT
jgi:uncharacterized protein